MNTLSCWFLTPNGWRDTSDRVAVYDPETWPGHTLIAGAFEEDPVTREPYWQEYWHAAETDEPALAAAVSSFGGSPPLSRAAATTPS